MDEEDGVPAPAAARQVRADVVGSLLRPDRLLRARRDLAEGRLSPARFKRIEDRAVDEAVALQEEAGLPVVTDGEMRRESFQSQLTEAVEGFAPHDLSAFAWGLWRGVEGAHDLRIERPPGLAVVGRLRRRRHLCAEEFTYLRARTDRIAKVTLPSPSLFANFWDPERPPEAYDTLDAFLEEVTRILREEVEELARLGCTYVQLDAPHYALHLEPRTRAFYERLGWGEGWVERGVELDNRVMEAADGGRAAVQESAGRGAGGAGAAGSGAAGSAGGLRITFGLHVCRGNQAGRWLVAGGYGLLAPAIFRRTRADRLLLEFDDERSGGFEPLDEVPEEKTVVLGLVSTKRRRLEDVEVLEGRIREAAGHHPLRRLAVSPQCGFSTSVLGSPLGRGDQAAKLRTVVAAAERVWGSAGG